MTATVELPGKLTVGDRCWVDGRPHRVVKVLDQCHWTEDRIADEDEFGREPGWYSDVETAPDELTPEEAARIAADEAERAARREKAAAEKREYDEAMGRLARRHAELIAGLTIAHDFNHSVLAGMVREELGIANRPGTGCSGTTELACYRDAGGTVKAVSFGCPYDLGPTYWIAPDLLARSADKKRVWQWWNPTGYRADSYPGPGVPIDQLTDEERAEVGRLEAARLDAIRQDQIRSARISAEFRLGEMGLVEPDPKHHIEPKACPVKSRSWSLETGPEFEDSLVATAAQMRARTGTRPQLLGLTLRVVLPAEAYAKKGRKPAPVDALPKSLVLHNFATATVVYEREG